MSLRRKIKAEEYLAAAIFIVVSAINILVFKNQVSLHEAVISMMRYFTFGEPFYGYFFFVIYGLTLFGWYHQLLFKTKRSAVSLLEPLRVIVPIVLAVAPLYALLNNLSYALRFVGHDELLAAADQLIFGTQPFIFLANNISADWTVHFLSTIYFSLSLAISGLLAVLFYWHRQTLFREMLIALLLSMVISYPIFFFLPSQDPNNYFIRNLRGAVISAEMKRELATYQPSVATKKAIAQIATAETNSAKDNAVPISCFPSMHAVWALLVVYFCYRLRRASLAITLPWLIVLLTSGLFLAQHYFVDYLIAVPVAVLSVLLARKMLRNTSDKK